ncbi:MAG: nucleotidyltransferase family protein [Pseudomonadota bacterium]
MKSSKNDFLEIITAKELLNKLLLSQIQRKSIPLGTVAQKTQWHQIETWIDAHGLSNLFLYACDEKNIIPDQTMQKWQTLQMQFMFKNLKFLKAGDYLFSILEASGINAVAMRGLTLLNKNYAEPWMRAMGDIDILIHKQDHVRFFETLKKHDIEPVETFRSQYVYHIQNLKTEIHWSFITAKRYRKKIDTSHFIDTRSLVKTKDGSFFCLSNENELIGLITHAFIHHELSILKQLFDIALFMAIDDIDWHYIANWCHHAKLSRMFVFTIHLVGSLFKLDVSDIVNHFKIVFPKQKQKVVETYVESFFKTRISQLIPRKNNMLYIAENPFTKLEQFINFFSMTEAKDVYIRYFK